jgi:hypothetical protein
MLGDIMKSAAFITRLMAWLRKRREGDRITEALNAIYTPENPGYLDPVLERIQFESIPPEDWD